MNQYKNKLMILGLFVIFLVGCFHEETEVSTVQYEFVNQTLNVLDQTDLIFTRVGKDFDESEFFGSSGFGSASSSMLLNSPKASQESHNFVEMLAKLKKLPDWHHGLSKLLEKVGTGEPILNLTRKLQTRIIHEESVTSSNNNFNISEKEVNKAFNTIFNPPTREGEVITYTIKTTLCDNVPLSERMDCLDVVSKISVVFTVSSDTSGLVAINIDGITPLSYQYSSTRLQVTIDFNAMKQSAESIANILDFDDTTNPFPTVFRGKMGVYVELSANNNAAEIGITVPEAINIDGEIDGEMIKFTLNESSDVIAIVANRTNASLGIEVGIGTLIVVFTDLMNDTFEFNLPAFTGLFSLDLLANSASVEDFGIGEIPATVDINNERALEITLPTFTAIIDGTLETLALETDFDFSLTANNVHSEINDLFSELGVSDPTDSSLSGTLSVSASAGLVISEPEATDSSIGVAKIDVGGPLVFVGSGAFLIDESVATDECFIWEENTSGFGSGFQRGDCSIWVNPEM